MLVYKSQLAIYNSICPACKARKGEPCKEKDKIVSLPNPLNMSKFLVHSDRLDPATEVK